MKPYSHTRIWLVTLKRLRLIAALTGERIVSVLERLSIAELERIQKGSDEA